MNDATIRELLAATTPILAKFLERILPTLPGDWWEQRVAPHLFEEQRIRLEKANLRKLSSLDLAALLKVFDHSWREISARKVLPREALNYLKEMRGIRNRWAHMPAGGFPFDDLLRDLDTIQRFATSIEASDAFIQETKSIKNTLIREHAEAMADESVPALSRVVKGQPGRIEVKSPEPLHREEPIRSSRGKDYTHYRFNGHDYGKGRLVLAVVKQHVRIHPEISLVQLQAVFPDQIQGSWGIVRQVKQILKNDDLPKRYFSKPEDRLRVTNGREEVVVCSQWGIGNIGRFLRQAQVLGYEIKVK